MHVIVNTHENKVHSAAQMSVSEYASNGSLYAYLRNPENELDFKQIVKWAEEIATGRTNLGVRIRVKKKKLNVVVDWLLVFNNHKVI